ncbi:hypothetical protein SAMN02745146_3276 [Hymenobacter daecheongensis DSM 21074]|uniref:Uncharacterized protein n=1 Tax=Hymenobacter daecheongensis DSM 21074 TaxID=1121955 RepID=A0A1M6JUY1_9BACT|nr:hypothetical protein [Hymenobacter daecheongensis]SHJ50483.1 hypothetical protein SAMN02745146_3276 [Hymenobacter daecheongensis DSM 21074]
MKKLYTTACLLLMLGAPLLRAQNVTSSDAVLHERVTSVSRRIAATAQLNEGQYVHVKRLNLVMITELESIKSRFAATPAVMDEKLAELQARYDWDLAALLKPQQLAAYNKAKLSTLALSGN